MKIVEKRRVRCVPNKGGARRSSVQLLARGFVSDSEDDAASYASSYTGSASRSARARPEDDAGSYSEGSGSGSDDDD